MQSHILLRLRAVQLYIVYTVLLSAFICSFLQALVYPLSFLSRIYWARLNQLLAYSPLGICVFTAEKIARVRIRVAGEYDKCVKLCSATLSDHQLVTMNHAGEIDWLVGFGLVNRSRMLGNMIAIAKEIIRYIPGIGWSFYLSGWIFVKRDSARDLKHIWRCAKKMTESPTRFALAILPEGTRFTTEKHKQSIAIANKKGLPVFTHHLTPRSRGFHTLVTALRDDPLLEYLVDITIVTPETANVSSVLNGDEIFCDVMLGFYPIGSIPAGSEQQSTEWLYQLFREKDRLVQYHRDNGRFPLELRGFDLPAVCTYVSIFWFILSAIPLIYLFYYLLATQQYTLLVGCLVSSWGVNKLVEKLLDMTRLRKASHYGKRKQA
ncbi:1-acyl-sn-glycerol-3-phosphate acyltransferase gamma [Oopsacas minuta]|uniref:1-acyl-sn-glycerol-3-phosphate acyltransferase gamma n=1 Tax=Oopsacas minuta TaxID=111878 RepID=A0AAV7K4A6_9METZ|nr:1-acyl-sn-glycerol-3-phosphate acyltransferase gamma [Oopsacas minuta]